MLKFRYVMLLIGLFAAHEMDANAAPTTKAVFQFTNQSPETVDIGVGTVKKPPKKANIEVAPKAHYPALKVLPAIDPNDGPELIIKANGKEDIYRFDPKAIKAGKSVKVEWKRGFVTKKDSLVAPMSVGNITAKDITIVEVEEPAEEPTDNNTTTTPSDDDDNSATPTPSDDDDEEPADEPPPPPKPKPTLSVTPEQVLGVTPSLKGDRRAAKILGMSFSKDIEEATNEPDENQPARLREAEWKKVKKARAAVTAAYDAQVATWKKVTTTAKNIMKRLKVEDSDEQEALAEEVKDLVDLTYKNIKARFVYDEDEKPADEPADDSSSSDDE